MIKGELAYLALDRKSGTFAMVIRRLDNGLVLPVWIGHPEAYAIAVGMMDIKMPRPLTHDLLSNVISAIGGKVTRIIISGLRVDTYYALIHIRGHDSENYVIDARPSDSIALALRTNAEILLSEEMTFYNLENPVTPMEVELKKILSKIEPEELLAF